MALLAFSISNLKLSHDAWTILSIYSSFWQYNSQQGHALTVKKRNTITAYLFRFIRLLHLRCINCFPNMTSLFHVQVIMVYSCHFSSDNLGKVVTISREYCSPLPTQLHVMTELLLGNTWGNHFQCTLPIAKCFISIPHTNDYGIPVKLFQHSNWQISASELKFMETKCQFLTIFCWLQHSSFCLFQLLLSFWNTFSKSHKTVIAQCCSVLVNNKKKQSQKCIEQAITSYITANVLIAQQNIWQS